MSIVVGTPFCDNFFFLLFCFTITIIMIIMVDLYGQNLLSQYFSTITIIVLIIINSCICNWNYYYNSIKIE